MIALLYTSAAIIFGIFISIVATIVLRSRLLKNAKSMERKVEELMLFERSLEKLEDFREKLRKQLSRNPLSLPLLDESPGGVGNRRNNDRNNRNATEARYHEKEVDPSTLPVPLLDESPRGTVPLAIYKKQLRNAAKARYHEKEVDPSTLPATDNATENKSAFDTTTPDDSDQDLRSAADLDNKKQPHPSTSPATINRTTDPDASSQSSSGDLAKIDQVVMIVENFLPTRHNTREPLDKLRDIVQSTDDTQSLMAVLPFNQFSGLNILGHKRGRRQNNKFTLLVDHIKGTFLSGLKDKNKNTNPPTCNPFGLIRNFLHEGDSALDNITETFKLRDNKVQYELIDGYPKLSKDPQNMSFSRSTLHVFLDYQYDKMQKFGEELNSREEIKYFKFYALRRINGPDSPSASASRETPSASASRETPSASASRETPSASRETPTLKRYMTRSNLTRIENQKGKTVFVVFSPHVKRRSSKKSSQQDRSSSSSSSLSSLLSLSPQAQLSPIPSSSSSSSHHQQYSARNYETQICTSILNYILAYGFLDYARQICFNAYDKLEPSIVDIGTFVAGLCFGKVEGASVSNDEKSYFAYAATPFVKERKPENLDYGRFEKKEVEEKEKEKKKEKEEKEEEEYDEEEKKKIARMKSLNFKTIDFGRNLFKSYNASLCEIGFTCTHIYFADNNDMHKYSLKETTKTTMRDDGNPEEYLMQFRDRFRLMLQFM